MKNWQIVKDFQLKFPKLVEALEKNTHHWDRESLNKFHLEGNTYAHTMMVLLQTENFHDNLNVRLAALCHDLGKPISTTRQEEQKKVRMFGHEGISVFLALDYLKTLPLKREDIVRICQLISFHTYLYHAMRTPGYELEVAKFFSGETELFLDLLSLTRADALGRFGEDEDRDIWLNVYDFFAPVLHKINPINYPRKTEKEAIVLIGPPLSGKSSWVKNNSKDYLIVSRDQVILDMGKGMSYNDAYKSVNLDKVNQKYDLLKRDSIKTGKNLIFDLTNVSEKSRRKTLSGLPKNMKRKAIVFLTGFETLKIRNEIRSNTENKKIPDYVIQNMMMSFSMPMISEGFDEIEYVFEKGVANE